MYRHACKHLTSTKAQSFLRLLTLLCITCTLTAHATHDDETSDIDHTRSAIDFGYATTIGSSSLSEGWGVATDTSGNVYTFGDLIGTADFDPGPDNYLLGIEHRDSIFIQKLDADGNFLWAKVTSAITSFIYALVLELDATGNVYTTGRFSGTVDFDPGPDTFNLTSTGRNDVFIRKMDSDGNFLWAKSIMGTDSEEMYLIYCHSIAVDTLGSIYATGRFRETVDFDPGPDTFTLTSPDQSDFFIAKLDSDGNFLWAKAIGGTGNDRGSQIAIAPSGDVCTIGIFEGIVDFDPGTDTFNLTSAGENDIFISKLDPDGNFLQAMAIGDAGSEFGAGIVIDDSGNIYTTGTFSGTVDFDPSTDTFNLTSIDEYDIFASKLDSDGQFQWAARIGGTGDEFVTNIALDDARAIYITGSFKETIEFPLNTGTKLVTTNGHYDIFITKLDSDGNIVWGETMGSSFDDPLYPWLGDVARDIAVDSSNNVYTTGRFSEVIDFDPTADTFNLDTDSFYNHEMFLLKLTGLPQVTSILRANTNPTTASTVNFTVTFSEPVTGVDKTDFILDTTYITDASITNLAGSGTTYTVTVNTGTGDGTVSIDLTDDDTIIDSENNPLLGAGPNYGSYTKGEKYTLGDGTRSSSSTCFIATAAYGTPLAREIDTLRTFRDTRLLTTPLGAAFTDTYYRLSPPIAQHISQHPILATLTRALLTPLLLLLTFTPSSVLPIATPITLLLIITRKKIRA